MLAAIAERLMAVIRFGLGVLAVNLLFSASVSAGPPDGSDTVVGGFSGELPGGSFTVNFTMNGKGEGDTSGTGTGIFRSRTVDWYSEETMGANKGEVLCLDATENGDDGTLSAGLFTRLTDVTPNIFDFQAGDLNINQFIDSNVENGAGDEVRFINTTLLVRLGLPQAEELEEAIYAGSCSYETIQGWFDLFEALGVGFPFLTSDEQKNLKIRDGFMP